MSSKIIILKIRAQALVHLASYQEVVISVAYRVLVFHSIEIVHRFASLSGSGFIHVCTSLVHAKDLFKII